MVKVKSKKTQAKSTVKPVARPKATRKRRRVQKFDPYTICRVNPFMSKGSTGIPDGNQSKKLVMDHRLQRTIKFGTTGSVGLVIAPCLPAPVWIYPFDNTTVVEGSSLTFNAANNYLVPQHVPEWSASTITYKNTAGNFDDVGTLFGADRARLVTAGWSLSYLGTTLNDSGLIRVTNGALSLETAVPNTAAFTIPSWFSATNSNISVDQCLVRCCNSPIGSTLFTTSYMTADTVLAPLRKGAHGVLKHSGKDYEPLPVSSNTVYIATQQNNNESLLMNQVADPTLTRQSGVCLFYDEQWDCTFITITGGTSGQSVLIDTVFCVEYFPIPQSEVYSLSKPSRDSPGIVAKTDKLVGELPIASVGGVLDTVKTVSSIVSTIGSVVAMV